MSPPTIHDSERRIVLASASPRRRQLLGLMGVSFDVHPANVNEDPLPGETPLETQHRITRDKARIVAERLASEESRSDVSDIHRFEPRTERFEPRTERVEPRTERVEPRTERVEPTTERVIVACDTTVLLDGEMLNKPTDADDARRMLRRLRGRVHDVQSAIVLRRAGDEVIDVASSLVLMRRYADAEIEAYIASGDPFDKAGSYAVQHATFRPVAEIRGCPLNVIGLALCHLRARLPWLPDSGPVCAAWFGRPCPSRLDDRAHVVTGAPRA
jgi:MAF protein